MKSVILKKMTALSVLAGVVIISGCSRPFDATKIENYVNDELGLEQFEVSSIPEEYKGEDGFKDTVWHVYDSEHDLYFDVTEDSYYSGESKTTILRNDFIARFAKEYDEAIPADSDLYYEFDKDDEIISAFITGRYSNKEELDKLMDDLDELYSYYEDIGIPTSVITYKLFLDCSDIGVSGEWDSDRLTVGELTDNNSSEQNDLYEDLIINSLDHRYLEGLEGFTDYETEDFINSCNSLNHLFVEGEMAEDLVISKKGISFATMYEILICNGFDVEGDNRNYSFTLADGTHYEISYDFSYEEDDNKIVYYYIKSDEKIELMTGSGAHFSAEEVEEMIGLTISEDDN